MGDSDHNVLSYTRYSKEPDSPARTIQRRCYKDFNKNSFLRDVSLINWSPVYAAKDVDGAEQAFTTLFLAVLDTHAPWSKY